MEDIICGEKLDEAKFKTPYSDISGTNYDAARVKMGGNWRMPTRAECASLINNCKIETGKYNNVDGFVITGPSGKSIFIPKAGYKKKENVLALGVGAYLWTSFTHSKSNAYYSFINVKAVGDVSYWSKYLGMPIRGVVNIE